MAVRDIVDGVFDGVTLALVQCGQACLKRLAKVVLVDVEAQMAEIFTPLWLDEGTQVHTAIATIDDYMKDVSCFLLPFWGPKFSVVLLEQMAVRYARAVMFRSRGGRCILSI